MNTITWTDAYNLLVASAVVSAGWNGVRAVVRRTCKNI